MNTEKLYEFIKNEGPVSCSRVRLFVASYPECVGGVEELMKNGYVKEKDGLIGITDKELE